MPWQEDARLAGWLHDLGKYGELFQRRLQGLEHGLDHWSVGAWIALRDFRSTLAAVCIQGHHIGLQQGGKSAFLSMSPDRLVTGHPLRLQWTGAADELKAKLEEDLGLPDLHAFRKIGALVGPGLMLEARLLFSALSDADFLDTEAHFQGDTSGKRFRHPGPLLEPDRALRLVLEHIAGLARETHASEGMRAVREILLRDVLVSAERDPGLFTFTAPTGSGKTWAMLAFALAHARRHGLQRVVLAVPYLSILEQTAKVYRDVLAPVFGEEYLLEHHSLAGMAEDRQGDPEKERLRRLHSENWDAPMVLTTNVQLLESLFSNRPSACRKLHRLEKSVILFDEAQTLPLGLALPTLAGLSQLASKAKCSIVFATATQPAYHSLSAQVLGVGGLEWRPIEAVASSDALFRRCRRVTPSWELAQGPWELGRLVEEIRGHAQVLCIVNLKRHALELTRSLRGEPGLFHLSTNLCPAHRRSVLERIRARLRAGERCRLVATQCVEAGVDLDFPVVFRALGPLESIAQAAGRCNREGRLETGRLRVFELVDGAYPDDSYHQAAAAARGLLVERRWSLDLDSPEIYEAYYRRLFNLARPEARSPELAEAIAAGDFVEVAKQYRLIRQDTINVLVPYQGAVPEYEALLDLEESPGIKVEWMRKAQMLAVACFRPASRHPAWGVLKPARMSFKRLESDEWFLLNDVPGWSYDEDTGLSLPDKQGALPVMIA